MAKLSTEQREFLVGVGLKFRPRYQAIFEEVKREI
jgi:hypothetical protein